MMRNVSAYIFVVAASLAGCAPTGDVEYAGEVHVTSPELVTISPGVQVVADADEPLFYSDGNYWLYRDNSWYRSDSYRGGFARVEVTYLPQRIRVIERPQAYVQYRRHGEGRYARDRQMQTRSQQSQPYTQPQQVQQPRQQQAPATSVPSQPDTYRPGDAHPTPRPEGINPNQATTAPTTPTAMPPHSTTTPPAAVTPNNPSAPAPGDQRFQQPIDRTNPPKSPVANPGPGIRPDDRTDPHAPGRIAPPGNNGMAPTNPGPGHDKDGTPAPAPGQNKNVAAPGNSGNAPGNSANAPGKNKDTGPQPQRPEDRNGARPDNDANGNANHGNPSAPNRVAPTAPTTSPASPSTGAAKDADKDKHNHDSPPGHSDKSDQKNDKKKNEKY